MRVCYLGAMPLARRCVTTLGFAVIFCASSAIPCAYAQSHETTPNEHRGTARRSFEQGEQAFEAGDFALAAKAFEEAYRIAPHYAPLWNAARSWERAGEATRAANGYAKYLRLAPADAPDRDSANAALGALAQKLGRIEVHAAGIEAVRIDDELLDGATVYVHPGMHVIEGQTERGTIRRTEMVEAGGVRSVALVEPKTDEEVEVQAKAPEPRRLPPRTVPITSQSRPDQAPSWFGPAAIVTGGFTIVSASLLAWSGVDTLSARQEFDAAPTAEKLEAGKEKQLRTNLFIGATVVSGVATGVFLSLWKWNGSTVRSAVTVLPPIGALPTQMVLTGSF